MEPVNEHDKPSPSDEKTFKKVDEGHDAKIRPEDKLYKRDAANAKTDNPQEYYQNEEQPVQPVTEAPKADQ